MGAHRIGIVGCGGIARRHIEGYRAVAQGLGEVVAGCDPDPEALARYCDTYGISKRFAHPQALIESGEVDVISLLTPPAVRGEVIFPAIEKGIHLLVEKPFGETLGDAMSFVAAAKQAGTALAVNHQLGFLPDILMLREIIDSGAIGDVRFVAHDQFQNRTRVQGWRSKEKRLEISIFSLHLIDRIRTLMPGAPQAVSAVTRAWNPDVAGETCTALTVQFEGGRIGTMVSNWHALTIPESRLRVDGTEGSVLSLKKGATGDGAMLIVQQLDGEAIHHDCSCDNAFTMVMGESMKRLLQAVDAGTEPPHSGQGNLHTMQIVDAAYLSAERGGKMVEIEEVVRLAEEGMA